MKNLTISKLDYTRIRENINHALYMRSITAVEAESLMKELNSARLVEPTEIPGNVVTMNSVVRISFLDSGRQVQFQLVYPKDANPREQKISIFSPIATALIGYKVGDEIEWLVPAGLTRIRIEEILYQPEASGDYNL